MERKIDNAKKFKSPVYILPSGIVCAFGRRQPLSFHIPVCD